MASTASQLKFTTSVEGVEVAEGTYKTASGVIRIPKSRMLEDARKEAAENLQEEKKPKVPVSKAPIKETPVKKLPQQTPTKAPEEVSFETPIGVMKAPYSPVIDQPNFIVLGLLPQSFIPTSYQENDKLVFKVRSSSIEECPAVYTGCKFTDPLYQSTYIILMKVRKS